MSNTVSAAYRLGARRAHQAASLYAKSGYRKYLNAAERQRALAAMRELPAEKALFAFTLAWTGARVSEVLALLPASFQVELGVVAIVTLKRRGFFVREIPIPPELMASLDRQFELRAAQRDPDSAYQRLWRWSRVTAWRIIKDVMLHAEIFGPRATPRGLRHAFGVGTLQAKVPINLTKTWLGHASLRTTEIYTAACGPEELAFAERFWEASRAVVIFPRSSRGVRDR